MVATFLLYLIIHFCIRLRGFAGTFSSRLGYNGLQSVFSGLDETDSSTRKKYPFELEKAIHNVMFIQHHIQRQDQFNAVSFLQFLVYSLEQNVRQTHFHFLFNSMDTVIIIKWMNFCKPDNTDIKLCTLCLFCICFIVASLVMK